MFSALSASSITVPVCSVELKQCCRHFELTVSVSYQSVTALVRRRRKNYHWRETCRERVLQKDKTLFSNCPSLFGRAKTVLSTFWADRVCLVSISYCAGYKKKPTTDVKRVVNVFCKRTRHCGFQSSHLGLDGLGRLDSVARRNRYL